MRQKLFLFCFVRITVRYIVRETMDTGYCLHRAREGRAEEMYTLVGDSGVKKYCADS